MKNTDGTSDGFILFLVILFFGIGIVVGFAIWGDTPSLSANCLMFVHAVSGVTHVVHIADHVYNNVKLISGCKS